MIQIINKEEFEQWCNKKFIVVGYPMAKEVTDGKHKDYDVFINVSDEFIMNYHLLVIKSGKQSHWFPMGEMHNDIGLVSIYGALTVMYQAYKKDLSIVLHCHAGINRSQTVRACFHYMMIGEHLPEKQDGRIIRRGNMLYHNCSSGHLPELEKMEAWLQACKTAFDDPDRFMGGMYDWTLRKANIQNI